MNIVLIIVGLAILFGVLLEAFESIILPRRVTRRFRLTRLFYRMSWIPWRAIGRRMNSIKTRESFFSYFGPMSLLFLLVLWAISLVVGFAFLILAAGPPAETYKAPIHFVDALYISGTNFFTLGLEDAVPRTASTRFLTVTEAGMGLGFLALVIGYLPVIFQSFSKREVSVVLLDARAGSPPTACGTTCAATLITAASKPSRNFFSNGSAGPRNCSRAIYPIPCSAISARSMTINPGSARSPRYSTPAR